MHSYVCGNIVTLGDILLILGSVCILLGTKYSSRVVAAYGVLGCLIRQSTHHSVTRQCYATARLKWRTDGR